MNPKCECIQKSGISQTFQTCVYVRFRKYVFRVFKLLFTIAVSVLAQFLTLLDSNTPRKIRLLLSSSFYKTLYIYKHDLKHNSWVLMCLTLKNHHQTIYKTLFPSMSFIYRVFFQRNF